MAATRLYSPRDTLKPANSMVASLGTGMQALSRSIRTNTPGQTHRIHHVHGHLDNGIRDRGEDEHRSEVG